ncbi:MAG: enoyl-CoA hydratase/isomerase family protein, partial [Euryarchaeota archaeon]|nr:enoyl-CoA hydratase/isomerase family protein [Euryarchaeota archaeon]
MAVIELASDSAGAPLEGDAMGPNTYTHGMMCDIDTAIIKARFDDDVTVIVITGNGAKFFSAGASIQMLNSVTPGFKYNFCLHANETLSRFEQTTKLVICAINGHAVGGGLEIAMAADIRIARKNAGKVGLPEINLGVLAGTGGTARLTRLIGKAKALEMMVTGELMSFEDAKD